MPTKTGPKPGMVPFQWHQFSSPVYFIHSDFLKILLMNILKLVDEYFYAYFCPQLFQLLMNILMVFPFLKVNDMLVTALEKQGVTFHENIRKVGTCLKFYENKKKRKLKQESAISPNFPKN